MVSAMDLSSGSFIPEWIPYAIMGACLVLLALISVIFRKLTGYRREIRKKEDFLHNLERELQVKESFQDKAFHIIAEVEKSSQHMKDLFEELARFFNFQSAVLIFQNQYAGITHSFTFPGEGVEPEKLMDWLTRTFPPERQHRMEPHPADLAELEEPFLIGALADTKKVIAFPFVHGGVLLGGMLICLEDEPWLRREKEITRMIEIFEALVSYRSLQSEIVFRNDEANIVSVFLTEMTVFVEVEKLVDAIYDFFRENYSHTNVSILLENHDEECSIKKGELLNEKLIFQLVPRARQEIQRGRQMLYAPDPISLMKKFDLVHRPADVQAVLIVPMVTFNHIFGYMVFESKTVNPFKFNTLTSLIRIVEVAAFVLRKTLYFEGELAKKAAKLEGLQATADTLARDIEEKNLSIQELSNFNSVFSLSQGVRMNLISLRGFLKLLEEAWKQAPASKQEPILFRNCVVEVEKIERSMQRFELTRVITDKDYRFRSEEVAAHDFLNRVYLGIRPKALSKRIEIDPKFDTRTGNIVLDPEMTLLAFNMFFDRILDFAAEGKLQLLSVQKDAWLDLLARFTPAQGGGPKTGPIFGDEFGSDFTYVLMGRTISRQGGQMNLEMTADHGFILHFLIPVRPAL